MELIFFYLFSFTAISGALIVVLSRKATYGVLALTLTMLALSGLFVLLQAYFVAVIQILIYAGAILVLFLFVIMLIGVGGAEHSETATNKPLPSLLKIRRALNVMLIAALLAGLWFTCSAIQKTQFQIQTAGTTEAIGTALFGRYLLPFELVSGVLLIGIFGVVNLTQKERDQEPS